MLVSKCLFSILMLAWFNPVTCASGDLKTSNVIESYLHWRPVPVRVTISRGLWRTDTRATPHWATGGTSSCRSSHRTSLSTHRCRVITVHSQVQVLYRSVSRCRKGARCPPRGSGCRRRTRKVRKNIFGLEKILSRSMTSSLQHAEMDTISVTCGDSGACLAPVILICCTCPVLVTCKCTGFTL